MTITLLQALEAMGPSTVVVTMGSGGSTQPSGPSSDSRSVRYRML